MTHMEASLSVTLVCALLGLVLLGFLGYQRWQLSRQRRREAEIRYLHAELEKQQRKLKDSMSVSALRYERIDLPVLPLTRR